MPFRAVPCRAGLSLEAHSRPWTRHCFRFSDLTMHGDAYTVHSASVGAALALRDETERRRLSSLVPTDAPSELHSLRLPKQPYTLVAGYGDGANFPVVHAPRLCLQRCVCDRWTRNRRRST
jgi:hypothetical protein